MQDYPTIYLVPSLQPGNNNDFIFYKDNDLEIEAQITWNGNKVKKINFTPVPNTSQALKYEILHVNPCIDENFKLKYMIHILERSDANPQTFPAKRNPHLKKLNFKAIKKNSVFFEFKIHKIRLTPEEIQTIGECSKYGATYTPETKDGSIIIGG